MSALTKAMHKKSDLRGEVQKRDAVATATLREPKRPYTSFLDIVNAKKYRAKAVRAAFRLTALSWMPGCRARRQIGNETAAKKVKGMMYDLMTCIMPRPCCTPLSLPHRPV